MDMIKHLKAVAVSFGEEPLFTLPNGQVTTLGQGYIPLLVNYTVEDKAAKGLRKGKLAHQKEPPIHFTALEVVRDHDYILLGGSTGTGKPSFAKHLGFQLATDGLVKPLPVYRNDIGSIRDEYWKAPGLTPLYFSAHGPESIEMFINDILSELLVSFEETGKPTNASFLIIIDAIDTAGNEGPDLIAKLLRLKPRIYKLVLLGDTNTVKHWNLSSEIVRHDLLLLLENQRRQKMSALTQTPPPQVGIGMGTTAATPIYFALASEARQEGNNAEELLDAWLSVVIPDEATSKLLGTEAFNRLLNQPPLNNLNDLSSSVKLANPQLLSSKAINQLLASRHLVDLPSETAIELFHKSPIEVEPVLRSLLLRLYRNGNPNDLIQGLIHGLDMNAHLGALLVSEFIDETSKLRSQILSHMTQIIESTLPFTQREKAARVLSRLGDPRDLTALAHVPEGTSIHGSESHTNSHPPHSIFLDSFRIGIYPVVNRDYSVFVRETNRDWHSPDGLSPERQNTPATDLTWYDAMAYCAWLTTRWRESGKINENEFVRLPTEPEWERAARGNQNPPGNDVLIYPWGSEWQDDYANYEESGLNNTCAVGLFPRGRSSYQVYDMGGNIWEWCTTLWGEDMTTPIFKYPWCDDGREDLDAPGSIRRVLRGGCFSSGRSKISTTYRGSLEAGGSWRGNGFRVVVVRNN